MNNNDNEQRSATQVQVQGFETFIRKAIRLKGVMQDIMGANDDELWQSRKFPYAACRAIVYAELQSAGYSTQRIGDYFARNHATILYSLKHLQDLLQTQQAEISSIYVEFKKRLNNE